jgi:hypothetical protein
MLVSAPAAGIIDINMMNKYSSLFHFLPLSKKMVFQPEWFYFAHRRFLEAL